MVTETVRIWYGQGNDMERELEGERGFDFIHLGVANALPPKKKSYSDK